jgi:hypothetical protein
MGALPRPELPPGPHRDLVDALHGLHHRAAWPSLRAATGPGVPVVGTWRLDDPTVPAPTLEWFTRVRRLPAVDELVLGPLTRDGTAEQVALLTGADPDPRPRRARSPGGPLGSRPRAGPDRAEGARRRRPVLDAHSPAESRPLGRPGRRRPRVSRVSPPWNCGPRQPENGTGSAGRTTRRTAGGAARRKRWRPARAPSPCGCCDGPHGTPANTFPSRLPSPIRLRRHGGRNQPAERPS